MKLVHRLFLIATFFISISALPAADSAQAEKIFKGLLAAQHARDYEAFIADADDNLKAALTKTQFEASSNIINERGDYEITSLGELNQHGYQVFLYRLRFKSGGDDFLATMSLKNNKVGGIYFH